MVSKPNLLICCLAVVLFSACTKDIYKRPMTIDRIELKNLAGEPYQEKFQQTTDWRLQVLDSIRQQNKAFVIDADSKKKFHKYNYTLEASVEKMVVNDIQGLYYQLHFKPNSGIGRLKTGQLDNRYVELKLYSMEKSFFGHNRDFYTHPDSLKPGASAGMLPAYELLEPHNVVSPEKGSIAVNTINFAKLFKKRQRKSLERMINNALVMSQPKNPRHAFNFYPNFRSKGKTTDATHTFSFDVTDNKAKNEIMVKLRYTGPKDPEMVSREATFNRQDFLDGHYYEAAQKVQSLLRLAKMLAVDNAFTIKAGATSK